MIRHFIGAGIGISLLLGCSSGSEEVTSLSKEDKQWTRYHGGYSSNKYSKLTQVNEENVSQLKLAWEYNFPLEESRSSVKCNPLVIDGILYGITASKNLVALDAATGEEIWYLDFKKLDSAGRQHSARGLHYWENGSDRRLLYGYAQNLYAINPDNGTVYTDFGKDGRVPLALGLDIQDDNWVALTTPGVVFKNLIIVGSFVSERLPSAAGHIRAFNVITGELEWVFHTIPQPGEEGYDTWPEDAYQYIGGANNWGGMSVDKERELVYIPTGSPTFDFYGANRKGKNLFGNSILALDANTGALSWYYQIVHHDLWDRDLPTAPNLFTVKEGNKEVDLLAQPTKQGYLFVFNRETGEPWYEIEEIPVPPSVVEGEEAWPTQPIPTAPPPFTRQTIDQEDLLRINPASYQYLSEELKRLNNAYYAPPDTVGVVMHPEVSGGANWGGAALDPRSNTLVVNANEVTGLVKLVNREVLLKNMQKDGAGFYQGYCASCHGEERQGLHFNPSLENVSEAYSKDEIENIIENGLGTMPAVQIGGDEREAIAAYLHGESVEVSSTAKAQEVDNKIYQKYTTEGYDILTDQEGHPANEPPWATLTAYDMNNGTIKWQLPLGEDDDPDLEAYEGPIGADNNGGPMMTAGDLVFIAATADHKFRAFRTSTGELLWEYKLPGIGMAVPATYSIDGKQFIVIPVSADRGDDFTGKYMAFSLDELE